MEAGRKKKPLYQNLNVHSKVVLECAQSILSFAKIVKNEHLLNFIQIAIYFIYTRMIKQLPLNHIT